MVKTLRRLVTRIPGQVEFVATNDRRETNHHTDMVSTSQEIVDADDASDDVAVPLFRHESFVEDVEQYVVLFHNFLR